MTPELRELLACPACGGHLDETKGDGLTCGSCGTTYSLVEGVPALLPPLEGESWIEWEEMQTLGLEAYEAEVDVPEHVRSTALAFAEFADLSGLVLDVGCGTAARPPYLDAERPARYVGVDPLRGARQREFEFVLGVGEHLPFRSRVFDCVVSATALDHAVDPASIVREMARVARPGGRVGVWLGIVDLTEVRRAATGSYRPPRPRSVRDRLLRPRGLGSAAVRHVLLNPVRRAAVELQLRLRDRAVIEAVYAERARYHFHFFKESDVVLLLEDAGLRVTASRIVRAEGHGTSMFCLAVNEDAA